jgi:mannose-6-phosphate isomerase-like protein (cupin superfamily)
MSADRARAVNLTQTAERLPRPSGQPRTIRILERGAGGPVFEVLARDGADDWPEEDGACDAIYVVISGEGALRRGDEVLDCAAGDVLFAPAGTPCRFEGLSRGFATWRILLGAA